MKINVKKTGKIALCRKCRGAGYIHISMPLRDPLTGKQKTKKSVCPQCQGSGRVIVSCDMNVDIRPFVDK